jgi:hypothetical protein
LKKKGAFAVHMGRQRETIVFKSLVELGQSLVFAIWLTEVAQCPFTQVTSWWTQSSQVG